MPVFIFVSILQEVFKVGEKLSALILGIDYDYSNISLSTAELEIVDGEVLSNKDQVWANAGAFFYKLYS
jgi:ribosomal protein S1